MGSFPFHPGGAVEAPVPDIVQPTHFLGPVQPETRETPRGELLTIRVSRYWPPLLGTNCGVARNGVCVSRTASGMPWEDWTERGAACPRAWLKKVQVYARGQWFSCVDTGGKIVYGADNIPWVDFMSQTPVAPYGSTIEVRVREWDGQS